MAKPLRGGWIAPTAYLMGAGWYFATCIVIGVALGLWLDTLTGLEPLFILLGIVLGLTLAIGGGIRMLIPFLKRFGQSPTSTDIPDSETPNPTTNGDPS